MPRSQRHDPDDDDRPAYGLRDDAEDDYLRSRPTLTPEEQKALRDEARRVRPRKDDDEDEGRDLDREQYQLRAIEDYSADPAVWLADTVMTQTEVALRLARHLIVSGIACSKVMVTLAGAELTHRENPQFPVDRFLTERLGFTRRGLRKDSWEGSYIMKDRPHALVLLDRDRLDGHLTTRLASGVRLIALASRGQIATVRGSAEHKCVKAAIGRAATWDSRAFDVLAICVPRSKLFSKAVRVFREREGVKRLRLHLLTVDRHSVDVDGVEELAAQSRDRRPQ
jgi:hypothetical protein